MKKEQAGHPTKKRLPSPVAYISAMERKRQLRCHHAIYLCFNGFLRVGKIVVPSDSAFDLSQHVVQGHCRTGSFCKGVQGPLCLVAMILAYMTLRGPADGPLFQFSNERTLTIRKVLQELGIDQNT